MQNGLACWRCRKPVDHGTPICHHCGAGLAAMPPQPVIVYHRHSMDPQHVGEGLRIIRQLIRMSVYISGAILLFMVIFLILSSVTMSRADREIRAENEKAQREREMWDAIMRERAGLPPRQSESAFGPIGMVVVSFVASVVAAFVFRAFARQHPPPQMVATTGSLRQHRPSPPFVPPKD